MAGMVLGVTLCLPHRRKPTWAAALPSREGASGSHLETSASRSLPTAVQRGWPLRLPPLPNSGAGVTSVKPEDKGLAGIQKGAVAASSDRGGVMEGAPRGSSGNWGPAPFPLSTSSYGSQHLSVLGKSCLHTFATLVPAGAQGAAGAGQGGGTQARGGLGGRVGETLQEGHGPEGDSAAGQVHGCHQAGQAGNERPRTDVLGGGLCGASGSGRLRGILSCTMQPSAIRMPSGALTKCQAHAPTSQNREGTEEPRGDTALCGPEGCLRNLPRALRPCSSRT